MCFPEFKGRGGENTTEAEREEERKRIEERDAEIKADRERQLGVAQDTARVRSFFDFAGSRTFTPITQNKSPNPGSPRASNIVNLSMPPNQRRQ
jgi:hypothetical protein